MPDGVLRTAVSQPVRTPRGRGSATRLHPIAANVTYPRCMHAPGRPRARRPWLPIVGAALAVAVVCAVAAWRPWVVPSSPPRHRMPHPPSPSRRRPSPFPRRPACWSSATRGSTARRRSSPPKGFAYVLGEDRGVGHRRRRHPRQRLPEARAGRRLVRRAHRLTRSRASTPTSSSSRDPSTIADCPPRDTGMPSPPPGMISPRSIRRRASSSSVRRRRCCRSNPPPPASTRTCRDLAAARGWWYVSPITDEWITTANYPP